MIAVFASLVWFGGCAPDHVQDAAVRKLKNNVSLV